MGDYDGTRVLNAPEKEIIGEMQVKGPAVFKEYYNRPEATKKEFTKDKWFKTRDTAEYVPSDGTDGYDGTFRILGRSNIDVIRYVLLPYLRQILNRNFEFDIMNYFVLI